MPQNKSDDDCSKKSPDSPATEADRFDLNLPVIGPGEEPLPHRQPHPAALANHIRALLRSRRKLSAEERAADKNPEPFRL